MAFQTIETICQIIKMDEEALRELAFHQDGKPNITPFHSSVPITSV